MAPFFFSPRTAVISAPPSPGTIAFDSCVARQSAFGEWVAVRHSISYWQGNGSFVNCKSFLSHQPADISLGGVSGRKLNSSPSPCVFYSVSLNILAHSGMSALHLTIYSAFDTIQKNPYSKNKETVYVVFEVVRFRDNDY